MKIAIIGAGIAGLTCARYLNDEHEVTLFESGDHIGGHVHTHAVSDGDTIQHVDSGFIVFNEEHYPNFSQLLSELRVKSQPTVMSFSLSCGSSGLEYSTASLAGLFAQKSNLVRPGFLRMLRDIIRFNQQGVELLSRLPSSTSLAEFVHREGYSSRFAENFLKPISAALWSCPLQEVESYPMEFILEFYLHHRMHHVLRFPMWKVIQGGSSEYVKKMVEPFPDRIRMRTPVVSVKRSAESVRVKTETEAYEFDEIIFACHADQSLRILGEDVSVVERELLRAFPFNRNQVCLHTDETLLPRYKRAWACWNYRRDETNNRDSTVTYYMNRLQSLRSTRTFCVSLNQGEKIKPEHIQKKMVYEHPTYQLNRKEIQSRHGEVIRNNRTSFCGAYWGNGFHEAGMVSGLKVLAAYGKLPGWAKVS